MACCRCQTRERPHTSRIRGDGDDGAAGAPLRRPPNVEATPPGDPFSAHVSRRPVARAGLLVRRAASAARGRLCAFPESAASPEAGAGVVRGTGLAALSPLKRAAVRKGAGRGEGGLGALRGASGAGGAVSGSATRRAASFGTRKRGNGGDGPAGDFRPQAEKGNPSPAGRGWAPWPRFMRTAAEEGWRGQRRGFSSFEYQGVGDLHRAIDNGGRFAKF